MLSVTQTIKTFKRVELLNKISERKDYSDDLTLTNIKLKCPAKTAYRLYDEFPPKLIAKNSDDSYTLNAAIPFDSWLCGFILSLGPEVEILEPENLKTEIAQLAEEIMKKHRKV